MQYIHIYVHICAPCLHKLPDSGVSDETEPYAAICALKMSVVHCVIESLLYVANHGSLYHITNLNVAAI